jgi:hypothetical protein
MLINSPTLIQPAPWQAPAVPEPEIGDSGDDQPETLPGQEYEEGGREDRGNGETQHAKAEHQGLQRGEAFGRHVMEHAEKKAGHGECQRQVDRCPDQPVQVVRNVQSMGHPAQQRPGAEQPEGDLPGLESGGAVAVPGNVAGTGQTEACQQQVGGSGRQFGRRVQAQEFVHAAVLRWWRVL